MDQCGCNKPNNGTEKFYHVLLQNVFRWKMKLSLFTWLFTQAQVKLTQTSFLSLNPQSYFLNVTKFLVKISQFEFLVRTEENIFCFMFINFFVIKYFRIQFIFYVKIPTFPLPSPSKRLPLLPHQPRLLSKLRSCQTPPF